MVDDIEMVSEDEGIVADLSGTMFISNIYGLCKKLIFVQGKGQRLQNWFFCFYQLDIIQRCWGFWWWKLAPLIAVYSKTLFVSASFISSTDISLSDVENVNNPMDKVVAGLQSYSSGEQKIPLTAVHVRAKLQDLTSEIRNIMTIWSFTQFQIIKSLLY